ncbi:MAG: type II toxin-antitoxin system prevent-host-death family antitoxin [Alphaproteobacteria bacterium]|nr:type II toxin-antitoxin system prevent-host-death family antitoxin [Alphaproteobacteria bacterium]MBU1527110.1 type II toxin-antitoxin system prevent-host-death family antitoxin [Alphaproteobacteria bacterium]MBU2116066.1 type II toxin-antitoxin system prevent-host-death family antitoxin [Alphaproteobacteria bacterium]MBU2350694.1 type II toxin-antitoxin system prevent-host-death family antitoxin [Alphaproteobacteria bacterium]MBU2383311.1 type II toxin-antitoxin system prevent-host-death fa
MERTISATDANREFSRLLGEVAAGQTFVVTSHGKPVARIVPLQADDSDRAERARKMRELLDQMARLPLRHAGRITRDDGYE